tara:strand:+ start:381984 stop:382664 length:681 start_codon:yes stop_codon:yes gene_type:complete
MIDRLVSYFEPFPLLLALVPLIGYLSLMGLIRVSGNTLITSGARDIAALGLAISGLVAVGPAELFFPMAAATAFGPFVWIVLIIFYALCVTLVAMTAKPKLVAYGRTAEEMYPLLLTAAQQIDADAVGDDEQMQVELPGAKVHLLAFSHPGIDFTYITSLEPNTSVTFWNLLLSNLRTQVASTPKTSPRQGYGMLLIAVGLASILLWQGLDKQTLVVEGFRDWLWR